MLAAVPREPGKGIVLVIPSHNGSECGHCGRERQAGFNARGCQWRRQRVIRANKVC